MSSQTFQQATDKFQRMAFRAAAAGFTASLALISLKFLFAQVAPTSASLQSSMEAAYLFLWPSAVLLLGAQTAHGGVVLFLLSACLNAGYFVFATMLVAAALERLRSRARIPARVVATRRSANSRLNDRVRSSRSAA
jgi:hypothetical protein